MKKAIVVGASSGIGHEVARLLIAEGWAVGVAARRIDKLTDLQTMAPERVYTTQIDVNNEDAETSLLQLIERMNGIDLYFHAAGIVGLYGDDFNIGADLLEKGGHACRQPAATDGDENGINRLRMLADDFHADGALSGDDVRVVEGRDVG